LAIRVYLLISRKQKNPGKVNKIQRIRKGKGIESGELGAEGTKLLQEFWGEFWGQNT
jgi:hypothetical protein